MITNIKPNISVVLVDASDQCNMLNFQLGVNGIGTTVATRSWNIKVKLMSFFPTVVKQRK
jgi:hypothetical protein